MWVDGEAREQGLIAPGRVTRRWQKNGAEFFGAVFAFLGLSTARCLKCSGAAAYVDKQPHGDGAEEEVELPGGLFFGVGVGECPLGTFR